MVNRGEYVCTSESLHVDLLLDMQVNYWLEHNNRLPLDE